MAEVKLYTWQGKENGVIALPDALFDVTPKPHVIHDAIVAQEANARVVLAHVKDRSEVSGGGKKPWKQKGTGRARHGSSRSPIWVGGGVTHGPQDNRNFSQKMNKKTKRTALAMLLTDKVRSQAFVAVENYELPEAKTKFAAEMRQSLPGAEHSALVIVTTGDVALKRAAANLPKTMTIHAHSVNVRDLAKYRMVIASQEAIQVMRDTFTV